MQSIKQLIRQEIRENPEVLLVLEIATRAREIEARELPQEISALHEVTAAPAYQQCAIC